MRSLDGLRGLAVSGGAGIERGSLGPGIGAPQGVSGGCGAGGTFDKYGVKSE